ncbi:MAG: hypothetical protein A2756_06330 [Candidatus Ryanbacteria bacterium RIFCSPHIGHO2_01_FULL_48_27]|uniref:Transcriptional regulator n=1 Tax=Candidatus Ryanbacteria bacterium RIFCSPHIGHO2_01_FULL_48_27 TaxID=1802115 RepID=A0A1G2G7Y9_9BACT|nr:MAG: hypothetical protein A2756_06330 [Candidatus Ryanbacteria bacterium RIFCSPHIGHO2_01_FULL_48_27]
MSGHSKWAQIKHKKALTDAKKGKAFSKLAKLITIAAREKGPNPDTNIQLRSAIEKAQAVNMPKDNIERAVAKGAGTDAAVLQNVLYEAYGPGGVALIVEGVTDNNNRTFAEIRKLMGDHGAKMTPGGALWLFEHDIEGWRPKNTISLSPRDQEQFENLLEELSEHDDVQEVYSNAA